MASAMTKELLQTEHSGYDLEGEECLLKQVEKVHPSLCLGWTGGF